MSYIYIRKPSVFHLIGWQLSSVTEDFLNWPLNLIHIVIHTNTPKIKQIPTTLYLYIYWCQDLGLNHVVVCFGLFFRKKKDKKGQLSSEIWEFVWIWHYFWWASNNRWILDIFLVKMLTCYRRNLDKQLLFCSYICWIKWKCEELHLITIFVGNYFYEFKIFL